MCDIIARVWYGRNDQVGEEKEGSSSAGEEKQEGSDCGIDEGTQSTTGEQTSADGKNDAGGVTVTDATACPVETRDNDPVGEDQTRQAESETKESGGKCTWTEVHRLLEKQRAEWKGQRATKIGAMEGGVYLVLGAFTHGGITGITKATEGNRDIAQAVNQAFKETRKHDTWAAVTIMHTPSVKVHSDNHNAPGSSNHIRAIARNEEVKVWIEDREGEVEIANGKEGTERIRGHVEDASREIVSFDPKKKHTILSESEDYWLITAYTPRGLGKLSAMQMVALQAMGFPTPSGSHEMWESSTGSVELAEGEMEELEKENESRALGEGYTLLRRQ